MWVQSQVGIEKWKHFLQEFSNIMLSSPQMYIRSITCICLVVVDFTKDIYDQFISVYSLIIKIDDFVCKGNYMLFYKLTPFILKVFYTESLKEAFYKRGGWEYLGDYLQSKEYIKWHDKFKNVSSTAEERLNKEFKDYIQKTTETLAYDPFDMVSRKLTDNNDFVIDDVTNKVISSLGTSLLEELNFLN